MTYQAVKAISVEYQDDGEWRVRQTREVDGYTWYVAQCAHCDYSHTDSDHARTLEMIASHNTTH